MRIKDGIMDFSWAEKPLEVRAALITMNMNSEKTILHFYVNAKWNANGLRFDIQKLFLQKHVRWS